jgi:hypothetical protein
MNKMSMPVAELCGHLIHETQKHEKRGEQAPYESWYKQLRRKGVHKDLLKTPADNLELIQILEGVKKEYYIHG